MRTPFDHRPRPPTHPESRSRSPRVGRSALAFLALAVVVLTSSATVWHLLATEAGSEPKADAEHADRPLNRLASSSSPYLLLHQRNPVDWYPWGEEALERARREDKPIFLSVGYSTCFWCHVMERESFSDPEIAALMNEHFVNIKVDREERPDLDAIYMTATQLMTGHGGWPNSVFLTPDLAPFFAGTYFPPDGQPGRPGFRKVLETLHRAWLGRRDDVERQADQMAAAIRNAIGPRTSSEPPGPEFVRKATDGLLDDFDAEWGGFGRAPKFPSPANLLLLLEQATTRDDVRAPLETTLDNIARGGIYDHAGGGFHRYATDREWKVPHFEKMLYDNAWLIEVYARWHALTGDRWAARVVRETAAFLAREMTDPKGGFWSAIDAETDGVEGAYYVWTRDELESLLGAEDAAFADDVLGFAGAPFFEDDHYVLHLPRTMAASAALLDLSLAELRARIDPMRAKILAARFRRDRPRTDDKVLADWNGMAIAGLATAGRLLDDRSLVDQAIRAADFVLTSMRKPESASRSATSEPILHHAWRGGEARIPAYLGDYAAMLRGLLALDEATDDPRWRAAATALADEMIARLGAPDGGFFAAAEDPHLLVRTKPVADGATPGDNAIAILALQTLASRTGAKRHAEQAATAMRTFGALAERAPGALRTLAIAVHRGQDPLTASAASDSVGTATPPLFDPTAEARGVVRARLESKPPANGQPATVTVHVEIEDGWHVNANPASNEFLIPTAIEGEGLGAVRYPAPILRRFAFSEEPLAVWEGTVSITAPITTSGDGEPRGDGITLIYQPCDHERCLPPVRLPLTADQGISP